MAVPTFTAAGAPSSQNGADPTPSYPAVTSGDLLLLFLSIRNATSTVNTPTGWTLIYGPESAGVRSWVFAKKSDGTETGTLTVDWVEDTANNIAQAAICGVSGWNDTGTLTAAFEAHNTTSGASTTDTPAALTTLGADRLVFAARHFIANVSASVAAYTGGTSVWTEHVNVGFSGGNNSCLAVDTTPQTSAGAIDGSDTITSTTWGNQVFAILPPSTAVTKGDSRLLLLGEGR